MNIFEEAKKYNFDAVKKYIFDGGDINICDENGHSLLTCFVNGYYMNVNMLTPEEEQLLEEHEGDDEFLGNFIPTILKIPLSERKDEIFEQLEFLFSNNANPNLCNMVDDCTETALMHSVCCLDIYFTKYLLEHGADPGIWLFEGHKIDEEDQEYWLLEELDYAIISGDARGECKRLVKDIAILLRDYGLKNWSGFALDFV